MADKETIKAAAQVAVSHGYALSEPVSKMLADIENPQYRVAIVGQFQVGKSTLVNRVFFGEEKLREGRGLATTSVATDTEYGDTRILEVYNWKDEQQQEEVLVKTVHNPTREDIDAVTVATDQDERTRLARTVSRVRITEPNEKLRGFTVIDTPGLDDVNQELLLNTTWRVIPSSDLALLVVKSRTLGERERDLLQKGVAENGISRIMVLVSFNPKVDEQDEDERAAIVDEIKAQLANMGRSDVEVLMYCYEPSIEDIISDVTELGLTLRTFLASNALPGRLEKTACKLKEDLQKILLKVAASLTAMDVSSDERAALNARAEREIERYRAKMDLVFEGIKTSVVNLEKSVEFQIGDAVDRACDEFVSEMEKQGTYSDLKRFLDASETTMRGKIMDRLALANLNVKASIDRIIDKYQIDIVEAESGMDGFLCEEIKIDKPMAAKISPVVVEIVNVLVLDYLLPMGLLTAIIARLCLPKGLNLVDWGARALVISQVKGTLDKEKASIKDGLTAQFSTSIEKAFVEIKSGLETQAREKVASLRSGLDDGAELSATTGAREKLESAKADLQRAIATL